MQTSKASRMPLWPRGIRSRIACLATLALLAGAWLTGCARSADFEPGDPAQWRAELQTPLAPRDADALTSGPTLREAITLALTRNPGLEAARRQWLAATERLPQATSLPDPMLQAGYQFDSVETRVGPQRWNLGLTQQLPWWRKLWARGQRAGTEADIARLRYETAARDLIIDVKDSYYELFYLDHALTVTERVEQLLINEGLLAYNELDSGKTQLGEAFKAESQAAQLAYDCLLLAEQRQAQAERLRSLLNLPPETPVGPIADAPVYPVADDLPALQARGEQWAQVLKIRGLENERAAYDAYLARLSRIPDVSLGLNFIQTGTARMAPKPADSGKDPIIGLFSMNLPIWEQRNRALIREKQAAEEAMKLQALDEVNQVRKGVAQADYQVRLTGRLVTLYEDTLLPEADSVMRQAEIDFRNGQTSFSSILETTLAWHNFTLAWLRARADHGQAIGRLERVLGATAQASLPEDLPQTPSAR